ncbi:hypothetical protein SAMN05444349_1222 [Bacteroides faecichinchillae]|uniref:Uncharacterized protein n=1 Tax=Bacteroides faecichinchillae TaxID=871325 RepID=A0A1M5C1Z9_9BACE|nr:hypothetical protein [Bacteroides faecichinchillae]THG66337.1 hypothetical protein E5981_10570 [Bacteroides faecichinchillae]SHF48788.1 hypothetical protein SAMN05444349_1222 [Bacteroides faecichinchillae]
MKNIVFIIFVAIATNNMYAQYVPIDTVMLNKAYRNLMVSDSRENQEAYFKAFPNNWMEYIATYQYYKDSLQDKKKNSQYHLAYKQVEAFGNLTVIPEDAYCKKLVYLAIGGRDDADAPSYLKSLLSQKMQVMSNCIFNVINKLKPGHQFEFWEFYWWAPYPGEEDSIELERLKKQYGEIYPIVVQNMVGAYKYFSGGINLVGWGYLESDKK